MIVGIFLASGLLVLIVLLVYRRQLAYGDAAIWLGGLVGILVATASADTSGPIFQALGQAGVSALVLIVVIFALTVSLSLATRLNRSEAKVRRLAQEIALLGARDHRGE